MAGRRRIGLAFLAVAMAGPLLVAVPGSAGAVPNPVAADEPSYQALGRVFPDPQGCLAYHAADDDGDGVKDTPDGVSPWAKGRACADDFLTYEEVTTGAEFLARRFPDFLRVIRLDEAYDNPNYRSAGLPRTAVGEDGSVKLLGRDRGPLYMFKVTDRDSPVPEPEREHFAFTLSIHGIERAGVEGGVRAMEDLVTWAACERGEHAADTPACASEGPFPKEIVETATDAAVPTAGEVLRESVVYFVLSNPDGWARGEKAPAEFQDGAPNATYTPGGFFQRYNGNGVDLNRDWPTLGYTFKPYSPGSEPETKAFAEVLRGVKDGTAQDRFAGGIDLHGMLTAHAFSYTLLGASQRDFRENAATVDTATRAWRDQTERLAWSPYVADTNADGVADEGETCVSGVDTGSRDAVPACVADEWGTVIDTIGYQITGALGDWIDSPIGLDGVGIDNEMYASHLAPNTVFEPALTQTHVDGNKGLIYSQLSALLAAEDVTFRPEGRVGYVHNPDRVQVSSRQRPDNPGLPAQNDIEVLLPCQDAVAPDLPGGCRGGHFAQDGGSPTFAFQVDGPADGVFNGGMTLTVTRANAGGVSDGNLGAVQLQYFDDGQWQVAAQDFNQSPLYLQAGQVVTVNDPQPGRWRVWFELPTQLPSRVKLDFHPTTAEASPGQAPIDASSMDFFADLNRHVPDGRELRPLDVATVVEEPEALSGFDSLVLVNHLGSRTYLRQELGLSREEVFQYFRNLERFVRQGGNLVLTDAAVRALPELLPVNPEEVRRGTALAGNYNFAISPETVTYTDPERYPLASGVDKPGAAEQEPGRRQAVEPTPLGYTPDTGYDEDPQMPLWGVDRSAWERVCGTKDCTTATTQPQGNIVNLGQARLGDGSVRIAGIMFPDPVYEPDEANDHRFGLASYALTYTSYEVFRNAVAYRRP